MKSALFVGGWEGHTPIDFADWYESLLEENGVEVDVHDRPEPLARPDDLRNLDLITPIWWWCNEIKNVPAPLEGQD